MIQRDLKRSCPSATWIPWIQDFLFLGVVRCKMKPDQKHKCLEVSERQAPKRHGQQGLDWSQPSEAPSRPQTHFIQFIPSNPCNPSSSTWEVLTPVRCIYGEIFEVLPQRFRALYCLKTGVKPLGSWLPSNVDLKAQLNSSKMDFPETACQQRGWLFFHYQGWRHVSNQHQSAINPLGSTRCSRCIKSTTRRLLSPQPAVKNRPMLSAKIVSWKAILAYACHVGIHTQCSYMSSKAAQSPFPGKRFGVTLRRWIDVPATSSSYSCDFDTDISRWSNVFS